MQSIIIVLNKTASIEDTVKLLKENGVFIMKIHIKYKMIYGETEVKISKLKKLKGVKSVSLNGKKTI